MIKIYKIYYEYLYQYYRNVYYVFFKKNNFFTDKPLLDKNKYIKIYNNYIKKKFDVIDNFEKKCGYSIETTWINELALHTQIVIKKSDICYEHGRVLYSSLRKYLQDNEKQTNIKIIETGTARGFSSLCMAKALKDHNVDGNITTFDIIPNDTKIYWNCIDDHEKKKTRKELLGKWSSLCDKYLTFICENSRKGIDKLRLDRIHFAFLDASHTYFDILKEFESIYPYQKKNDIIIFDDYSEIKFYGLYTAINKLCFKYNYKKEIIQINDDRSYVVAVKN